MPDISACVNTLCSQRAKCYRFMCVWNELRQSYSLFLPDDSGKCEHIMPIDGRATSPLEAADKSAAAAARAAGWAK